MKYQKQCLEEIATRHIVQIATRHTTFFTWSLCFRWRTELTRTWWRRTTTSGNTCSRSRWTKRQKRPLITVLVKYHESGDNDGQEIHRTGQGRVLIKRSWLKCIENTGWWQNGNLQVLLEKVDRTLEASRQAQEALNRDLDMKDVAFGIDQTCLVLSTTGTIWDRWIHNFVMRLLVCFSNLIYCVGILFDVE